MKKIITGIEFVRWIKLFCSIQHQLKQQQKQQQQQQDDLTLMEKFMKKRKKILRTNNLHL